MVNNEMRHDSPQALLKLFQDKLRSRGARGMVGLQRIFKIMDDDGSGTLSQREFYKACRDFKVGISEENVPTLFRLFDSNNDGTLDYDEFLYKVRGEISQQRIEIVRKAFQRMDTANSGQVDMDQIRSNSQAHRHPDVINGKRSEQNLLCEFLETFEAHHLLMNDPYDQTVTEKEFVEYYKNISAITEEDNVFNLVIGNTWGLKGDGPTYKRNPKHMPKTEEPASDYLPSHKAQNVMRSGMGSTGNPLNNTNKYYPPTNSA